MRNLACFLLLCSGSVATLAAETWRWVDANGVTHYSDRPEPGAERVDLGSRVVPPSSTPTPPPQVTTSASAAAQAATFAPYTECMITNPVNDQTFQNPQNIAVSIQLSPALQGDHRIEVRLNGSPVQNWPESALSYSLTEVFRGSYTLSARVLDEAGRQLCSGPVTSFHVRQPTVNSPTRPRPAPRN